MSIKSNKWDKFNQLSLYNKIMLCMIGVLFILVFLKLLRVDEKLGLPGILDYDKLEEENEKYKNLGTNPTVRVLITGENFKGNTHKKLTLEGDTLEITFGEDKKERVELSELSLSPKDKYFDQGSVVVKLLEGKQEDSGITITSFERNYGHPTYLGSLEIYSTGDNLVMINELPLETYLRSVVPSEMPASYELEALKAQAVCARSYAYSHMQTISYPEYNAHMNDSVSFQVYNNSKKADKSDRAILETASQKAGIDGKVVTTYFFSTSSGHTTDVRAWGTKLSEGNAYLQGIKVGDDKLHYEKDMTWYQWDIEVGTKVLEEILELNLSTEIGTLKDVAITDVGAGGVALAMEVIGTKKTITVKGEYDIREALGSSKLNIKKNDGNTSKGTNLLPSAFITIDKKGDTYLIHGGGLGHGIGMSQNGANEMAKLGMGYKEILTTFYQGIELIRE